ncbi:MAG: RNA polymerase sigma-70 factor (ECF subfamily) [Bradymonadia bacterium]|jgi:RNA polymerase sigma-70 factor (ECF subfamily)
MQLTLTQPRFPAVVSNASDRAERFERFVLQHHPQALRMAFRLVGSDQAAAEDVTQETFLKAHRALGTFREDAELSTWFYRILVRQASNYRRKMGTRRRIQSFLGFDDRVEAKRTDPLLRDAIAGALEHLTGPQRTVFVLVHLEQFTVADAAASMGCAVGTAKSHLHRALKSLRITLSEHRDDH